MQSPFGPLKAFLILFPHHPQRLGSHHYPQVKYGETEAQKGVGLVQGHITIKDDWNLCQGFRALQPPSLHKLGKD